jgi:hypothetical protein
MTVADLVNGRRASLLSDVARGLLRSNTKDLRAPFGQLHPPAEEVLQIMVQQIPQEQYNEYCSLAGIDSTRKPSYKLLAYGELIRLAEQSYSSAKEEARLDSIRRLQKTTKVRNAFSHSKFDEVSIQDCLEAFESYANFVGVNQQLLLVK